MTDTGKPIGAAEMHLLAQIPAEFLQGLPSVWGCFQACLLHTAFFLHGALSPTPSWASSFQLPAQPWVPGNLSLITTCYEGPTPSLPSYKSAPKRKEPYPYQWLAQVLNVLATFRIQLLLLNWMVTSFNLQRLYFSLWMTQESTCIRKIFPASSLSLLTPGP